MQKYIRWISLFLLLAVGVSAGPQAAEWYVDNQRGNDTNPGTREQPLRSLEAGCNALKGGDTLHLIPNIEPYRGLIMIKGKERAGTPERPTVVDGHGAKLNRLTYFGPENWKDEGSGVFSMKFANNCVSMFHLGYWCGFPFVHLDGKVIDWVKTREELRPSSYLLMLRKYIAAGQPDPLNGMLYVRLPEGKTPADVRIEAPGFTACGVEADYVMVKDLDVEWCSADAFDTAWSKGIVFDRVRSSYCMDQGISNHSTDRVLVRDSRFAQATDGGILDVHLRPGAVCRAKYVGCRIEHNFQMGGACFFDGEYTLENCLIRDNDGCGAMIRRTTSGGENPPTIRLVNCRIVRGIGNAKTGISVEAKCRLEMEGCTVEGFAEGVRLGSGCSALLRNNTFLDCQVAVLSPELPAGNLQSDGNSFTKASTFEYNKQKAENLASWTRLTGQDAHSMELAQPIDIRLPRSSARP